MPKLKVLQLEFWMKYDDNWNERTKNHPSYIGPAIYNRDGWYLLGDDCWFEYDGNAFKTTGLYETFKYQLKLLDIPLLTDDQAENIKTLCYSLPKSHNKLKKDLITVLRHDRESKSIRNIGRQSRKHSIQSMVRLKKLKKSRGT